MNAFAGRRFSVPRLSTQHLLLVAFSAALSVSLSPAAWAQAIGVSPGGPAGHNARPEPQKPAEPAPDAVPGDKARAPAAPASRAGADMQPTEALFDAINRGDIAGARDALNRGADLNGVNILGMTPMDLSVDLGRNDISFLLLSMRGEDSGRGSRAEGRDIAPPNAKTAQAAKHARSARSRPTAATQVATKPAATPRLFANDGGSPLPSAGFLGFGSHPSSN